MINDLDLVGGFVMKKKKVMLLGGNYYQMTATKAAKRLGCHVISVDYLPDNPAHKYADEYYNVSTIDKDAVLKLAQELEIDGIVSYASDVSAPTAAYVAEKMGLPTNPYESVLKLTRKDFIRPFMEKNNFNVPKGKGFTNFDEAFKFFKTIKKPAMVKPVDASGSKGVIKIFRNEEFKSAFNTSMSYSISKNIIVEEFIQRDGYQIAGDGFLVNGELRFAGLMNEHFDKLCNPLVPIGESYPSILPDDLKEKARLEIQRMMDLLGMKNGALNLDFIVDKTGDVYILEIGPRNGGNLITDAIKEATDVDLAEYTIRNAVGEPCNDLKEKAVNQYVSSYVIHALDDGIFDSLWISDKIKDDIILSDLFVPYGAKVHRFDNGGFGIGAMLIKHKDIDEMLYRMDHMEEFIKVVLK